MPRSRVVPASVLHPGLLIGGLTNQIYGLVGLVFIANLTGSPLVLPRMLSHVTGGGKCCAQALSPVSPFQQYARLWSQMRCR